MLAVILLYTNETLTSYVYYIFAPNKVAYAMPSGLGGNVAGSKLVESAIDTPW